MEIKEILDYLKIENGHCSSELSYEETHLLLDYITKLQQENERLEKHKEYYKNETKRLGKLFYITKEENIKLKEAQINFEKQFIKETDYKSRIEKAVEYIEQNEFYLDYKTGACIKGVMPLLNILNGKE